VAEPGSNPNQAIKREATDLSTADALDVGGVDVELGRCGTHRQATSRESRGDCGCHRTLHAKDVFLGGSVRRDSVAGRKVTALWLRICSHQTCLSPEMNQTYVLLVMMPTRAC
jgi:hypothetical protein